MKVQDAFFLGFCIVLLSTCGYKTAERIDAMPAVLDPRKDLPAPTISMEEASARYLKLHPLDRIFVVTCRFFDETDLEYNLRATVEHLDTARQLYGARA